MEFLWTYRQSNRHHIGYVQMQHFWQLALSYLVPVDPQHLLVGTHHLAVTSRAEISQENLVLLPFFLLSSLFFNAHGFFCVLLRATDIDASTGLFFWIKNEVLSLFSMFQSTTVNSPFSFFIWIFVYFFIVYPWSLLSILLKDLISLSYLRDSS